MHPVADPPELQPGCYGPVLLLGALAVAGALALARGLWRALGGL